MNQMEPKTLASTRPKNLINLAVSLACGYFAAAVLTSRSISNWAMQLPATESSEALEILVKTHAKRSSNFGGDKLTRTLESDFQSFHERAKVPLLTNEVITPQSDSNPSRPSSTLMHNPSPLMTEYRRKGGAKDIDKQRPNLSVNKKDVLLIGDSLMAGIGPTLKISLARKQKLKSNLIAKIGTGLARPDRFNWAETLKKEARLQKYQKMIVLLGTNDTQNIKLGRKGFLFGGTAWLKTYSARVDEIMRISCESSESVYWLGLPAMRDKEFNRKAMHLNKVIKSVAANHDCVRYLDLNPGKESEDYQAYASHGDHQVKIRAPDGIHYTPAGALLLTNAILPKILHKSDISRKNEVYSESKN